MAGHAEQSPRAQQRRRTEARILAEARRLFAETGYDATTIRTVAAAASIDPALVMRYFGSKEELFNRATQLPAEAPPSGPPEEVAGRMLASLRDKLSAEPVAMLAMLRSMLTHHDATASVRELIAKQQAQLSAELDVPDAGLRTGLVGSLMLGVVIARYLLELQDVRDAPPEQIIDLLRPCFQTLTGLAPTEPEQPERLAAG